MRKERISFSITKHVCLQQTFMVHCTWPWFMHSVCPYSYTLGLDLHAHTQWHCLLLLRQRGGGVHVLKYILHFPFE